MKRRPRTFMIAEAGVNHNGSLRTALRLVDAAFRSGADAVKFQTFRAEGVVSPGAPLAPYQRRGRGRAGTQEDLIRPLELGPEEFRAVAARCKRLGIQFLSTPFDEWSVRFLVKTLHVRLLKIPSGEVTNGPLLMAIARARRPLLLSTGMATLAEIRRALGLIAFAWSPRAAERPSEAKFEAAYRSPSLRRRLARGVTLMQCTTAYPTPFADAHLLAMDTLRREFMLPVGFSDHTPGIAVSVAAAARGAAVIEKHLTLDRGLPGPDHQASLEPAEFADLVRSVREVESALGDGRKRPRAVESANRAVARRGLVALRAVQKGEVWSEATLGARRPARGLDPFKFWQLTGTRARRTYRAGEAVR